MDGAKILVTGATGATGREAVWLLLEHCHVVRAFVHTRDNRSDALAEAGAEIVLGDLRDFGSVRAALDGVRSAYFLPHRARHSAGHRLFRPGCEGNWRSSYRQYVAGNYAPYAKSHAAQDHWIAERIFARSGVPVVHLRPTFFAEWVLSGQRSSRPVCCRYRSEPVVTLRSRRKTRPG